MTTNATVIPFPQTSAADDRLAMNAVDLAYYDLVITVMSGIEQDLFADDAFETQRAA